MSGEAKKLVAKDDESSKPFENTREKIKRAPYRRQKAGNENPSGGTLPKEEKGERKKDDYYFLFRPRLQRRFFLFAGSECGFKQNPVGVNMWFSNETRGVFSDDYD